MLCTIPSSLPLSHPRSHTNKYEHEDEDEDEDKVYKNSRSIALHKSPNKEFFWKKEIVFDDRVTHIFYNDRFHECFNGHNLYNKY